MTQTVHLIVGPPEHGVCRHGELIAEALGHPVVRAERPELVPVADLRGAAVVHVPYTDRLFAEHCEDSAEALLALTAPLRAAGSAISVTLHDLPAGDSDLETRRRAAYQRVVAQARGIVVQSGRELTLVEELVEHARSLRRIPLPVISTPPRPAQPSTDVVVLGFVFPDRGYEHTIAELPAEVDLLALGGPAKGHEDLPDQLARLARHHGHQLRTSGFVPDADLPDRLAEAGVPVAPNRRVAASGSIATWLGHGRRPLVPATPYTRELAADWPDTLTLYDPDCPGDLRRAIEQARSDPSSTWLAPGTRPGPSLAEVGTAYAEHFLGCAPDARIQVGDRWVVPGNRWDLLADLTPEPPTVSVVVPYFEAQQQLDRVLAALRAQTHPAQRLQVVVADDGSAQPPRVGPDVQLVRQPDQGFRAAAARNLGAGAADGDVLLFLDGDTVPEPDYVRRLCRLPALTSDALTVGRRRHADFATDPPTGLSEPGWLRDNYAASADLLEVDDRSYRYVISAVLGLHRDLFAEVGGFSEAFTAYGGEDWELAHRAFVAGAVLAHVADAVAWHHGPDWAGRGAPNKNAETLALTRLLPDPVARGGGQWLPYPAAVIRLHVTNPAAVLATARSAFGSGADCGFWVSDLTTAAALGDPRIQAGPVPAGVLARASVVADLTVPAALTDLPALIGATQRAGRLSTPVGTFTATRAGNRSERWSVPLAALFGTRDVAAPRPLATVDLATVDLAHELKQIGQLP